MSKICLTCKINDKMNDGKIPKWYKEIGNDSLLPPILNKNKSYSLDNKDNFVEEIPNLSNTEVSIDVDKEPSNKWLFYWAADPQVSFSLINDPKTAYNNEDNHGLVKTDKDGNAKLVLNCPQPYKVDNITYPRHVHYTLESDNKWDKDIRTLVITCNIDYKQMKDILKNKSHIVLNALSEDSFKEYHIPGSINLDYKLLDKLNNVKKKSKIKKFIKENLREYSDELKEIDILDVPIVTYCAHKKCDASNKLVEHLIESGFVNVLEYPGGNEDFKNNSEKNENTVDKDTPNISEDMFDLDLDKEMIVYEGVKYYHLLKSGDIENIDGKNVGTYDGLKIKWNSKTEEDNHLSNTSDNEVVEDVKEENVDEDKVSDYEEDKVSDDEEDTVSDDEEDTVSDDEDKVSDDEEDTVSDEEDKVPEDKKESNTSKLNMLKKILNKTDKSTEIKIENKIDDKITIKDNTLITKKNFDKEFRGWGFFKFD